MTCSDGFVFIMRLTLTLICVFYLWFKTVSVLLVVVELSVWEMHVMCSSLKQIPIATLNK